MCFSNQNVLFHFPLPLSLYCRCLYDELNTMPVIAVRYKNCSKCSFRPHKNHFVKDFNRENRYNRKDAVNLEMEGTQESLHGKRGKTRQHFYLPHSNPIVQRGRRISGESKARKSSDSIASSTDNSLLLRRDYTENKRKHSSVSLAGHTSFDKRITASDSMIEELQFKLARLRVSTKMVNIYLMNYF